MVHEVKHGLGKACDQLNGFPNAVEFQRRLPGRESLFYQDLSHRRGRSLFAQGSLSPLGNVQPLTDTCIPEGRGAGCTLPPSGVSGTAVLGCSVDRLSWVRTAARCGMLTPPPRGPWLNACTVLGAGTQSLPQDWVVIWLKAKLCLFIKPTTVGFPILFFLF